MWRWLLGFALILGAAIGVILGALNPDPVTLELVFLEWTASLGAIVAISVCAGLALGFSFATVLMLFRGRSRGRSKAVSPVTRSEAGKRLTNA